MAMYMITYDLLRPGQNYEEVREEIKQCSTGKWANPCESFFIIESNMSAEDIVSRLYALDDTDKVLVVSVRAPGAWEGMTDEVSKWLYDNL